MKATCYESKTLQNYSQVIGLQFVGFRFRNFALKLELLTKTQQKI